MNMEVLKKYQKFLGDNDFKFLNRVYERPMEEYINRLKQIGFKSSEKVLDIGCGFGQWSIALGKLNKEVFGCDVASDRIIVASEIAKSFSMDNVHYSYGSLEEVNFPDNYFDTVFCYGSLFIANPEKALKEFNRVLKSGGKLYVNANGLGWTLNYWINSPNKAKDHDPIANAVKAFNNTLNYRKGMPKGEGQIIIEPEELLELMKDSGFVNAICKPEGMINLSIDEKIKENPFFKEKYHGFTGVYEIIAEKK